MQKVLAAVERIIYYLLAFLLAAMSLVMFTNVVLRYVFQSPINWTEEICVLFFVWIVFLASVIVQKKNRHVAINVVYELFSPSMRRKIDLVSQLSVLFILVILVAGSVTLVQRQHHSLTPYLMLPMSIYSVAGLICFPLMLIYTALSTWETINALRGKQPFSAGKGPSEEEIV